MGKKGLKGKFIIEQIVKLLFEMRCDRKIMAQLWLTEIARKVSTCKKMTFFLLYVCVFSQLSK